MNIKNLKKKSKRPIIANLPVKKPSKAKFISTLIVIALGVAIMPSGLLLSNLVQEKIDEGVADQVKVPHPHSSDFNEWETNDYEDAPEMYSTYYMWNLTNPDEFLEGDKPNYEQVGPFVFRQYTYKYDIDFNDDMDEVEYKEYSTYVQAGGDNISEVYITNLNPGFLGSVATAGGTDLLYDQMSFPFALDILRKEFEQIYTDTIDETLSDDQWINDTMQEMLKDCVNLAYGTPPFGIPYTVVELMLDCLTFDVLRNFLSNNLPSWEEVFYEEWANDYFPKFKGNYTYLNDSISYTDPLGLGPGLKTLLENINKLILSDPDIQDAMDEAITKTSADLVDESGSASGVGVDIEYGLYGETVGSEADLNISRTVVTEGPRLWKDFLSVVEMNLTTYITNGGSGLNYTQCLELWNESNPNSLTGMDFETNKIWYDALDGDIESHQFLNDTFNINDTQLDFILDWINVSTRTWQPNAMNYQLNEWNSGVIVKRSVDDWLFNANDTGIHNYMDYYGFKNVKRADIGFLDNCYNTGEAEEAALGGVKTIKSRTVKTGRDDVSKVGQFVEYDGQDTIYLWGEPEEIEGTDGMQFAPGVNSEDNLKTFQPDLMRVVELEYDEDTEIYDIDLLRYRLSDDTFTANPVYFMDTSGLINCQSIEKYQGIELRLSRPHLLGTPNNILHAVNGMKPNGDIHETYVDVEPNTGIVMNARMCMQVNFELIPTEFYMPNISSVITPILWFEQSGEIPEELAEDFKDLVYGALELKDNLPLWALGIGACLTAPSAGLSTSQVKKRRKFKQGKFAKRDKMFKNKIGTIMQKLGINTQDIGSGGVDKIKTDKTSKLVNNDASKPENNT